MKRFVKKLNQEVDCYQIQVSENVYDLLREIKWTGRFKSFDKTIEWIIKTNNELCEKALKNDNR